MKHQDGPMEINCHLLWKIEVKLFEENSITKTKTMLPVAKNKKINSNAEIRIHALILMR